jgi:hypothetical protein
MFPGLIQLACVAPGIAGCGLASMAEAGATFVVPLLRAGRGRLAIWLKFP